ncbi:MAG: ABC transporter permease [Acidobacteria bacterium]|nr:ABC transporter permease [Acidobacteriota bacterium]
MQTFWQDLRFGARMLMKQPGFTLIAVLTLALGIGATTAIFSVVNAVLLQPLSYPMSDRLVAVSLNDSEGEFGNTGFATFVDFQARAHSFDKLALIRSWGGTLTGQGEPENIQGLRVTPEYFQMLGVRPALGRDFRAEDNRPDTRFVVVISSALWQRRFNSDPQVIGKPIVLSGQTFNVIGVMPPEFDDLLSVNFYQKAEVWAALGYDVSQPWACRSCQHLKAFGRLKDGVTLEQARVEMNGIAAALQREFPQEYPVGTAVVLGLQDEFVGKIRPALYLLLIAVGVVLLIACANVANLLLARATDRAREMAVRSALGAGRFRIIRQLLVESLLLSGLGATIGLVLAVWGVDLLMALKPANVLNLQPVTVNGRVLWFAVGIAMLTGILFGLAPALQSSKPDLQMALKNTERQMTGGNRLRSLLVVAELTLAMVLLVGAGLLSKSFVRLLNIAPGFETGNLITMMVPASGQRYNDENAIRQFYREVLQRVSSLPGVESAGIVSNLPLSGNGDRSGFHIEEKPLPNPASAPSIERYGVSPDYFRTMRIQLKRGRAFTEQDSSEAPLVAIIGETAARRFWPGENPLGKRVRLGGLEDKLRTIVGIVNDVQHFGLDDAPDIQIYVPHDQWTDSFMELAVRTTADPAGIISSIRREVKAVDKDAPIYQVATMNQLVATTTAQRRFTLLLVGIFAGLSLVMAGLGIYSVIAYSVTQRTHEIGIRLALGAQTRDVLQLVLRQGFKLTSFGLALGLIASLALTRLMENLLFGVSATDPMTIVMVAMLLLAVGLLACWLPARRATKVDPMIALRCE